MRRFMTLILPLALAVGLIAAPASAQVKPAPAPAATAPVANPGVSPAQAQSALDVLTNDARRNELISTLQVIVKTQPAPGAAAAGTTAAAAAAKPGGAPGVASGKLPIPLAPDSLGAQVLVGASERLSTLSGDIIETTRAVTDFPLIVSWVTNVARDPASRLAVLDAAWKLLVVLSVGLAGEYGVWRLLRRPIKRLEELAPRRRADDPAAVASNSAEAVQDSVRDNARSSDAPDDAHDDAHDTPDDADAPSADRALADGVPADRPAGPPRRRPSALTLLRRLPYVVGRFLLDIVPVVVFAALCYALLGTPLANHGTARLVILAVVNATILLQAVTSFTRMCVAPTAPRLRLFHMSDESAAYAVRWVRRIVAVAVFGYAFTEVALLFGLYAIAHDALLKIVSLVVHVMLVVVVLQSRASVAKRIRARSGARGAMSVIRNRLARSWHYIAIFYIVALWLVWAFEVTNGFSRLVRFFVATVLVVTVARLVGIAAVGAIDRALRISPDLSSRYPGLESRARSYGPVARVVVSAVVTLAAILVLFEAWGIDSLSWFASGALGGRLLTAGATIGVVIVASLLIWELVNVGIERHLERLAREAQAARSARLRTLLPMMRTALFVAITLISGLMILSQIGVNVAPLLAGAGVIGLAIGFGSQKLVQDIITGLFLLLENAMQVGDVVSLGGLSGTVENLSVRTIRLRAVDGAVHIIPFSAVTTVTNMTRDFSYAVLDVSVGLNEEPDAISDVLRDLVRTMRDEPRWQSALRDELEVMGVDKFIDLAWVLRIRVKTLPSQRWAVGRELNRRIKYCFDDRAIESPFTSHRVLSMSPPPAAQSPAADPSAADPPAASSPAANPLAVAGTPAKSSA